MERVFDHKNTRRISEILNQVVDQFDNTGTVSLSTTGTTTTVTFRKVNVGSRVFLQPRDAAAAASGLFVQSISNGSFVIGHTANSAARTVDFAVFVL